MNRNRAAAVVPCHIAVIMMVEFVLAVKSVVGRELGRTSLGSSIIVVLSLI
jgi:hypothetical protein